MVLIYLTNFLISFFTAAESNPLATTQLYDSKMDTHLYPIKYLHPLLIQIINNQIHVVQFILPKLFPTTLSLTLVQTI